MPTTTRRAAAAAAAAAEERDDVLTITELPAELLTSIAAVLGSARAVLDFGETSTVANHATKDDAVWLPLAVGRFRLLREIRAAGDISAVRGLDLYRMHLGLDIDRR